MVMKRQVNKVSKVSSVSPVVMRLDVVCADVFPSGKGVQTLRHNYRYCPHQISQPRSLWDRDISVNRKRSLATRVSGYT